MTVLLLHLLTCTPLYDGHFSKRNGCGQNLGPGPWASPWATLWAILWATLWATPKNYYYYFFFDKNKNKLK